MTSSLCRRVFVCLFCCLLLAACKDKRPIPGTAATVDGQIITLQELEGRRAELFSGRSPESAAVDDSVLLAQYRYVLAGLIEEQVICRFMEKRGLAASDATVDAEERRVRADYPEGGFEEMLISEGLAFDTWRRGLYRKLTVEAFLHHVLRPEVSISADEVQDYYLAHSDEFMLAEQWHFLQITGRERQDVSAALAALAAGREAEAVQKEFPVSIHDIRMGVDLLPEDVSRVLAPLKAGEASKILAQGKDLRAWVLLEKIPALLLDPAEISRRVELVLAEEKMRAVYAAWITKQKSKADIRIAAPLATGEAGPLAPPENLARNATSANATLPGAGADDASKP